ncbi:hypothetical protein HO133_000938 [Letharia lupina]|uniref:Uncharacterized protein n=1 Tax=Letharia lupina TaxID=560253 RepID=A0A8H6CG36_9LECA|nr:uncharacterized protein HO133_000938 [Letharia lupina]KAF6222887.1 hypothetical protein HO133_000938 [Letharia lupina]
MRPTKPPPFRPTSPNIDPVPPGASTRIADLGHIPTASPTRNPVPAAPSSNEARQQVLLANNSSQAAMIARLQAMPPASDTTDMSTETVDPGREVANRRYLAMLAQRDIRARDHALLGSDDSTDAGGGAGAGAALSYAVRARGVGPRCVRVDRERERGRLASLGGRGRAVSLGQESGDGELERVIPLQVRKMPSG